MVRGELPHRMKQLHEQYGEVVRVAPRELSIIDPVAWKDIYQNPNLYRPAIWRGKPPGADGDNLISASEADHSRFRKVLFPAFSDQAVRKQEPIIKGYVDLLMRQLHDEVKNSPQGTSTVINVIDWFTYTVFDIIGDLGWGSSFECLENQKLNDWIEVVLYFKALVFVISFKYFPPLDSILDAITPKAALADIHQAVETAKDRVARRIASKIKRPDIMGHVIAQTESSHSLYMTKGEMDLNAMLLIVAGSESLTTILSGTVNNLLANPETLQKLVREVRISFSSEDEIDGTSTRSLVYLNAVLQEGMRSTPSIPDGSHRDVPAEGATVAGIFVPGGTTISIPQWSAYTSSLNFVNSTSFVPERWLPEASLPSSIYSRDRKGIFHPFSYGAHNCLGQRLAWLQMRVILARFVWNFDLKVPESTVPLKWSSQKVYMTWVKKPILAKISPR